MDSVGKVLFIVSELSRGLNSGARFRWKLVHGTRYSLTLMQTRALPLSGSVQAHQPAPTPPTSDGDFPVAPDVGKGPARPVDAATAVPADAVEQDRAHFTGR